jgi:hypothetical protein
MRGARTAAGVLAVVAAVAAAPSGAGATALVGRVSRGPALVQCAPDTSYAVSTFASGQPNPWRIPEPGVITQWRSRVAPAPGAVALQVLRESQPSAAFEVVAESDPETVDAPEVNRFFTRVPVAGGELIGLRTEGGFAYCADTSAGEGLARFERSPAPRPGDGSVAYAAGPEGGLNVEAVLEPDVDRDGYGDETQDGCPADAQRHDECVDPAVRITDRPGTRTKARKATFRFVSDDLRAGFECKLDGGRYSRCRSPLRLRRLTAARHVLLVRAREGGVVGSPARYAWRIERQRASRRESLRGSLPGGGSVTLSVRFGATRRYHFRVRDIAMDCADGSRARMSFGGGMSFGKANRDKDHFGLGAEGDPFFGWRFEGVLKHRRVAEGTVEAHRLRRGTDDVRCESGELAWRARPAPR